MPLKIGSRGPKFGKDHIESSKHLFFSLEKFWIWIKGSRIIFQPSIIFFRVEKILDLDGSLTKLFPPIQPLKSKVVGGFLDTENGLTPGIFPLCGPENWRFLLRQKNSCPVKSHGEVLYRKKNAIATQSSHYSQSFV